MFTTRRMMAFILVLLMIVAVPATLAQDATATPDAQTDQGDQQQLLICDSTLTLLVGLATRDYGYTGPGTSELEGGQYGSYMMPDAADFGGDGEIDMGENTQAEETPEMSADAMATEEAAVDSATAGQDGGSMVILNPPIVTGEDLRCTEIRTSLEDFFSSENRQPGSSMDEMDSSNNAG